MLKAETIRNIQAEIEWEGTNCLHHRPKGYAERMDAHNAQALKKKQVRWPKFAFPSAANPTGRAAVAEEVLHSLHKLFGL